MKVGGSILKQEGKIEIPKEDLNIIGKFFSHMIPAFLKEEMGILHDNVSFKRWKLYVKMCQEAYELVGDRQELFQTLPMKFAVAFTAKAPLEDETELKKMWVHLLANTALEGGNRNHVYVSILGELTGNDAKCLEYMFMKANSVQHLKLWKLKFHKKDFDEYLQVSPEDIKVIINNLTRLGLIEASRDDLPKVDISQLTDLQSMRDYLQKIDSHINLGSRLVLTQLGYNFIKACSPPPPQK